MRRRGAEGPVWVMFRYLTFPLLLGSVFLIIWLRAGVTSLEYRISELEKQKLGLLSRQKELVTLRSEMLSMKAVERVAMDKLGLSFPDRKKIVYVKREGEADHYSVQFHVQEK